MRKDRYKNSIDCDMTCMDMNVPNIYSPKGRGKTKKRLRKIARARLKAEVRAREVEEEAKEIE